MRLIPLGIITFLLGGCFFQPVEDFVDQMDDQYFADEFNYIPTEIKPYDKKASMELIWENKVGDNEVNNFNLVFSEEFVIAATSDGSVRKMKINSGETVWKKEFSQKIMIGVGGNIENILFIAEDGYLWCLDGKGEAIWKIFVDGEALTTPVINNDKAYVRLANYGILQVDLKQGDVDWRYIHSSPSLTFNGTSSLAFSDGIIYGGFGAGKLVAIHQKSGAFMWEATISQIKGVTDIERLNDVLSQPLINNREIYAASTSGDLTAIDRRNVNTIWTRKISSFKNLAFDGFDIYLTHKSDSLYSLDSKNGKTNWRNADLQYRRVTNPIITGDYVAVGDFDGYIHLLNIESGAIEGRAQITSNVPIGKNIHSMGNDKIIGMDMDGNVFYMQVRNIAEEVIEDKSTNPEGNEEDKIEGTEEVNSDIDEFFIILE
ncbi:MAG: outer membrane protein assembly factor BamB [Nitrosomonadales bacterium]|jgi:outer membrane protein assembly factor BamB|nr:outer membrane protein assembly factor BamB [Nitrosomonadales bacterium]MBT4759289.1 outer membrane protein assembly factor BamB [Nitrosomonadales bacterium]